MATHKNRGWSAFSALLLALLLMRGAAAQTFVVDPAGGAGVYQSIATATAVAPDGSILLVRAGVYTPFTIDGKSLTILCDHNVVVSDLGDVATVTSLGVGQQVTIRVMELNSIGGRNVSLVDCEGTVLLDGCVLQSETRLRCTACDDVRLRESRLFAGVVVTSGAVQMSGCELTGFSPLSATDSQVQIADSSVNGSFVAASLANSALRILSGTTVGTTLGPVVGGVGTVRIDPSVSVMSFGQTFAAGIAVSMPEMPKLAADAGMGFGGLASGTLTGPANSFGALWLGPAARATTAVGLPEPVLLPLDGALLQSVGPLHTPLGATYTVPLTFAVRGLRVAWQGACFDAVRGLQISNAVTYVHF
ncbi:MAG: hypothetical protein AB8H80_11320 [Planctomycetota bacterium]